MSDAPGWPAAASVSTCPDRDWGERSPASTADTSVLIRDFG